MKIAVAGCNGRMGQTLVAAVRADARFTLVGGSGREAIKADFPVVASAAELVAMSDAVIDFTSPENSLAIAEAAANKGSIHIIGTTGFSDAQKKQLATFAGKARIVMSGNFSLGVNLLESLVEQAAKKLADYDIEISEMHHKHKKDAPSGTALMLGEAAARGRKNPVGAEGEAQDPVLTLRVPQDNSPRKTGEIGLSYARGGDVVGIHTVTFAGAGEVLELKHQGFNREIYATGALHAALWAHTQKAGLYSMRDVLATA